MSETSQPRLVLTGEIGSDGRYLSLVSGHPVTHTHAQYVALCRLVLARWTTQQGRLSRDAVCISPENSYQIVVRLRREFDAVQPGAGGALVLSMRNGTYRLGVEATEIALRSDFREVEDDLPERLFRGLIRACPNWVELDGASGVEVPNDSAVSVECQRPQLSWSQMTQRTDERR